MTNQYEGKFAKNVGTFTWDTLEVFVPSSSGKDVPLGDVWGSAMVEFGQRLVSESDTIFSIPDGPVYHGILPVISGSRNSFVHKFTWTIARWVKQYEDATV